MRQKGYLRRWILPTSNLYECLPEIMAKYKDKPIGNSPEYMPWDAHLNQDVHACHDLHTVVSEKLEEDDERKFSGSTPQRLLHSYVRLLHPTTGIVPSSNRIMHDIKRVFDSMEKVREMKGCMIDENYYKRDGRRFENNEVRKRGGSRKKNSQDTYRMAIKGVLHSDLEDVRNALIQDSVRLQSDESNDDNDV